MSSTTAPARPRTATSTDAAEPAHRSSRLLGVLPYIGAILFAWHAGQILLGSRTGDWKQDIVMFGVIDLIGIAGIGAGVAHVVFGPPIARSIGWEHTPFQTEVGFANLGFGIAAVMAASQSPEYWLAVIIANGVFRAGAGLVHIREMVTHRDFAINNTMILVVNFVVPAFLYLAWHAWA